MATEKRDFGNGKHEGNITLWKMIGLYPNPGFWKGLAPVFLYIAVAIIKANLSTIVGNTALNLMIEDLQSAI